MRILYISYDGLTDPLGQAQILPYLAGLSRLGYRFHITSLEKPDAFAAHQHRVSAILKENNIEWTPVDYNTAKGLKAKLDNDRALKKAVKNTLIHGHFNLVHARSYPAAIMAMSASRKYKIPFVFDMRGFWADERVEGKIWNLNKPHHKILYRYFKKKEKELLKNSAQVISLTQAAKDHMVKTFHREIGSEKITVIPCCADLDFFKPHALNLTGRSTLGISPESQVLIYLGSVGTWYLLDEMADFFKTFSAVYPSAVFLVVTQNEHELVHAAFRKKNIGAEQYRVVSAGRHEVPAYIACANAAVFFVRPSFSKMASSPVKLAELMGSGLPVFANAGIGDMDYHARETTELHLVKELNDTTYRKSIENFTRQPHSAEKARAFAMTNYSLSNGIEMYRRVYEKIPGINAGNG
jgi:glycosyltransferase involved in cell wall biosynthesis